MAEQVITQGVVLGFVPNQPDLVNISDGFHQIVAYVTGDTSQIRAGQTYTVYKLNSTYYLGVRLNEHV